MENLVAPVDGHSITGQVNPALHGTSGPVLITLPATSTQIDPLIMNASRQLSSEFPFTEDYNSGNGVGLGMSTIRLQQ